MVYSTMTIIYFARGKSLAEIFPCIIYDLLLFTCEKGKK